MRNFATKIIINKTIANSYIDGMALAMLICDKKQLKKIRKTRMRNGATTNHQLAILILFLVLMLLAVLLFALPVFADTTAVETVATADTGDMNRPLGRQEANKLDDAELGKIHGKGLLFFIAQPEIMPAVILWDESGKGRGSNTGTSETIIRINVFSETANTR